MWRCSKLHVSVEILLAKNYWRYGTFSPKMASEVVSKHINTCMQYISTCRTGWVLGQDLATAFDAQLRKVYFITTLYLRSLLFTWHSLWECYLSNCRLTLVWSCSVTSVSYWLRCQSYVAAGNNSIFPDVFSFHDCLCSTCTPCQIEVINVHRRPWALFRETGDLCSNIYL